MKDGAQVKWRAIFGWLPTIYASYRIPRNFAGVRNSQESVLTLTGRSSAARQIAGVY
jgi:hypothetical protein